MGLRWVWLSVAVTVSLFGCGKKPRTGTVLAKSSAAKPEAPGSASAAVTKPNTLAPTPEPTTKPEDEAWHPEAYEPALADDASKLFKRELLVARKAVTEKRYDDALTHYTQALSTGSNDAQCLGERGYVRLLKQDADGAAGDLWFAAGAVGSDRILSQVWYNLGLAYAEQKQPEPELSRAAFARSLALAPSSQASAKLGRQSRCQTSVRQRAALTKVSSAVVVDGWRGVDQFLQPGAEVKTEAEARASACSFKSEYSFAAAPPEPNCTDAAPWIMSCCAGMGHFMAQYMMVYPRPKDRFFAIQYGSIGGWPRECQGAVLPEPTIYGSHLVLKTVQSVIEPNGDFDQARIADPTVDPPCHVGPRELELDVYDLDTAALVLEVRSLTPHPPELTINAAGTAATLNGSDCNATFSLTKD